MWPSFLINTVGTLSSYEPKFLSDAVKRSTSASSSGSGKELIYSSKDTLNSGPQVDNVSKSWSLPPGTKLPSEICIYIQLFMILIPCKYNYNLLCDIDIYAPEPACQMCPQCHHCQCQTIQVSLSNS